MHGETEKRPRNPGRFTLPVNFAGPPGYKPVTFSELTDDEVFWQGCRSCPNFDVLTRTERRHCLCTGMLFDPGPKTGPSEA